MINNYRVIDLLKNNYGNYVVQKAMKLASGINRMKLISAVSKGIEKIGDRRLVLKWKSIIECSIVELSTLYPMPAITEFNNSNNSNTSVNYNNSYSNNSVNTSYSYNDGYSFNQQSSGQNYNNKSMQNFSNQVYQNSQSNYNSQGYGGKGSFQLSSQAASGRFVEPSESDYVRDYKITVNAACSNANSNNIGRAVPGNVAPIYYQAKGGSNNEYKVISTSKVNSK